MSARLEIPIPMLRAAALCAAHQDVRFYLNAVRVECEGGRGRIVSTDGACMFVGRFDAPRNERVATLIPRDLLDAAEPELRSTKPRCQEVATASVVIEPARVSIELERVTYSAKPLDGRFPEWQQVIPKECSGAPAVYHPRLWSTFTRCARMFRVVHPVIYPNGESAGLGGLGNDALFVAMPMRVGAIKAPLAWASSHAAQIAAAVAGEGASA